MDFYIPKNKRELIDWLYWFYDGSISKSSIRQKDVEKWYFKLRLSGAYKSKKKEKKAVEMS